MNFEPLYKVWAPLDGRWSPWVKPVLFAADTRIGVNDPSLAHFSREFPWLSKSDLRTALIIDCPGDESLAIGVAAARAGFHPVPLFNACTGENEVISQSPLFAVIEYATDQLRRTSLTPDAPPAFLLDSRRLKPERPPRPGDFDNRWMVLPQDFPSANFLLAHGIETVLLVQPTAGPPQQDLSHILLRWQKAGLFLRSVSTGTAEKATAAGTDRAETAVVWLAVGRAAGGLRIANARRRRLRRRCAATVFVGRSKLRLTEAIESRSCRRQNGLSTFLAARNSIAFST